MLEEDSGKTYSIQLVDDSVKIKGLGIFNPDKMLSNLEIGGLIEISGKHLRRIPPRLPTLVRSMKRRAQTISDKDAGVLISKLGIGAGDVVLEAGIGSGGLSLHLAKVLGSEGQLITAEPRLEHSAVALENLERAKEVWTSFPHHSHHDTTVEDAAEHLHKSDQGVDVAILDLPEHPSAIHAIAPLLPSGGRVACYCPVSSQLEDAWSACEEAGLTVEWAGEIIERQWGKASKGGMRPINGPFGHTAFLIIAVSN